MTLPASGQVLVNGQLGGVEQTMAAVFGSVEEPFLVDSLEVQLLEHLVTLYDGQLGGLHAEHGDDSLQTFADMWRKVHFLVKYWTEEVMGAERV